MAKQGVAVRQQRDSYKNENSSSTREQYETIIAQIDSPLPDPGDLERYHALDPTLLQWLKEHVTKEQDFRHDTFKRKLSIAEKESTNFRWLNALGMIFGFIVYMAGLGIGSYLIYLGNTTWGMVFSGVTLIGAASVFLNRKNNKDTADTKLEK